MKERLREIHQMRLPKEEKSQQQKL